VRLAYAHLRRLADLCRQLAADRPDASLPNLGTVLTNCAIAMGCLGRREDAVRAIDEAIAIRRRLATVLPDAFTAASAESERVRDWVLCNGGAEGQMAGG
jgi:hypothetical protein